MMSKSREIGEQRDAFHRPTMRRVSVSRQVLPLHTLQPAALCSSAAVMKGTLSDRSWGEIAEKSVTKASRCSSSTRFIWSCNTDILKKQPFIFQASV